jgi:hypothetical protein
MSPVPPHEFAGAVARRSCSEANGPESRARNSSASGRLFTFIIAPLSSEAGAAAVRTKENDS